MSRYRLPVGTWVKNALTGEYGRFQEWRDMYGRRISARDVDADSRVVVCLGEPKAIEHRDCWRVTALYPEMDNAPTF